MTPNLEGPWKPIYHAYELNQTGMVRRTKAGGNKRAGYFIKPGKGATVSAVYMLVNQNGKRIQASVRSLIKQTWGIDVTVGKKWREEAQRLVQECNEQQNPGLVRQNKWAHKKLHKPAPKERRCTTCGRPTTDYRCAECWLAIRGEVTEDYTTQYPGRSAYAGAATLYCDSEAGGLV